MKKSFIPSQRVGEESLINVSINSPRLRERAKGRLEPLEVLDAVYDSLYKRYGSQHWWPGDTAFEVMVGAVLTQSAAWANVEKAIANLKSADVLSPQALRDIALNKLAQLIYPSGYFNAKATKLKALVNWYGSYYRDDLQKLRKRQLEPLRNELLGVFGVGEETADSILLYAADKPSFVIDAYTQRIFTRMGVLPEKDSYSDWRQMFMKTLKPDVTMFNEYHALIVRHGKDVCTKSKPKCSDCCLRELCASAESA